MANYIGRTRSNYVAVKNAAVWEAWCDGLDLQTIQSKQPDGSLRWGFLCHDTAPSERYNEATESYDPIDFEAEIAVHLVDGEVLVFQGIGYENMRVLDGYAVAVHSDGRYMSLNIDDIYNQAKAMFDVADIGLAQY